MQKDYSFRVTEESVSDVAEIAAFWTAKWNAQSMQIPELDQVLESEEYRSIHEYLQNLPLNSKVLDGGCGLGHWTLYFNSLGHQSVGIDISRPTVEHLSNLFPDCEFVYGDIRELPFADETFNLYFSWGTFEHFEEGMERVLKEAFRVLKPGGYVLASVPFDNLRHQFRRRSRPKFPVNPQLDPNVFYQWRFTEQEIVREFTQRGFVVDAIVPLHKEQGASRMLTIDFGIARGSRLQAYGAKLLAKVLPSSFVAHMLMVVAQKPQILDQ